MPNAAVTTIADVVEVSRAIPLTPGMSTPFSCRIAKLVPNPAESAGHDNRRPDPGFSCEVRLPTLTSLLFDVLLRRPAPGWIRAAVLRSDALHLTDPTDHPERKLS